MNRPTISPDRDRWRLLDEHGDLWELTPTGDRSCPLVIALVQRNDRPTNSTALPHAG